MLVTLFQDAMAYPTIMWTVGLSFVMLYWLLVAGGALDTEQADHAVFIEKTRVSEPRHAPAHARAAPRKSRRVMEFIGLRQVPYSVWATVIVMVNFVACRKALQYAGAVSTWYGAGLVTAVFLVSLPLTMLIIQAVKPLFKKCATPVDN